MKQDEICLHSEMDEKGTVRIVDQFGRILCGVKSLSVNRAVDEGATITLTAYEYRGGKLFINEAKDG